MKFLLSQTLDFKKEQTIFYVYPNEFSAQFIRIANKLDLVFDIQYSWNNGHKIVYCYEILENDFKKIYSIFRNKIEKKRSKFYSRPYLEQLILILRYIFKRNLKAKEVSSYHASQKAYGDKSDFLRIALDVAKKVDRKNFIYGWQKDPDESYYCYIYYFEIKDKQVSFHSNEFYPNVPEFNGKWIGVRNLKYPFSLIEIKSIM